MVRTQEQISKNAPENTQHGSLAYVYGSIKDNFGTATPKNIFSEPSLNNAPSLQQNKNQQAVEWAKRLSVNRITPLLL